MRIGKTIGNVTLCRVHESFTGAQLKLVVPLTLAELDSGSEPQGESLVAWDELGTGVGQIVCFSEGGEAAQPFRPNPKAVDAYISAMLDNVSLDHKLTANLLKKE